MKTILAIVAISSICSLSLADSDKTETKCMDLGGGLRIVAKINANTYVADIWGMLTPKVRIVLMTSGTEFSNGLINEHIWIDVPLKNAERKTVQTTDGFSETYDVARETGSCTAEGQKVAARLKIKQKQWDKEAADQEAENIKENEEHEKEDAIRDAQREASTGN